MDLIRRFVVPGVGFLIGSALQIGGWTNQGVALALMGIAAVWAIVAAVTWPPIVSRVHFLWTKVVQRVGRVQSAAAVKEIRQLRFDLAKAQIETHELRAKLAATEVPPPKPVRLPLDNELVILVRHDGLPAYEALLGAMEHVRNSLQHREGWAPVVAHFASRFIIPIAEERRAYIVNALDPSIDRSLEDAFDAMYATYNGILHYLVMIGRVDHTVLPDAVTLTKALDLDDVFIRQYRRLMSGIGREDIKRTMLIQGFEQRHREILRQFAVMGSQSDHDTSAGQP